MSSRSLQIQAAQLLAGGRPDEAARLCRSVLSDDPGQAAALHMLGIAAAGRSDHGTAAVHLGRAFRTNPATGSDALFTALYNDGCILLHVAGDPKGALGRFGRALELRPEDPAARLGQAMALLHLGDYAEGWKEYGWRWRVPAIRAAIRAAMPALPCPRWQGEDLAGRSILLWAEQGFGDTLQFIRYAPLVRRLGAAVYVRCPAELRRLFSRIPGVTVLEEGQEETQPAPAVDFHAPLMDLPHLFGTGLDDIPFADSYLEADPALVQAWRGRLAVHPGFRVGLVWAGNPRRHNPSANALDRRRSIGLEEFAILGGMAGITFFSLQKGQGGEDLRHPPPGLQIIDPMDDVADFADTAALLANLDLLVTVDTSVAHLAGALGRPVWMLSRFDGCWRWLSDREDSPWYSSMRIFRQTEAGNWGPALQRLRQALEEAAERATLRGAARSDHPA